MFGLETTSQLCSPVPCTLSNTGSANVKRLGTGQHGCQSIGINRKASHAGQTDDQGHCRERLKGPGTNQRLRVNSVAWRTRRVHLVERVEKPTDSRPRGCFVAARLMPISPALAPAHFPHTPSVRLGPRLLRRKSPVPAEDGTGRRNMTSIPRQGGTRKETEVACGCPHRVEPHAEEIMHG